MKNILITGGAGYIGSHVAENLLARKLNIFIIDKLKKGNKNLINRRCSYIKGNIIEINKVKKVLIKNKIDSIIHLAALIDVQDGERNKLKFYKNNVLATKNLIKACNNTYVKNIIYSSSAGVYGNSKSPVTENSKKRPINYYSKTKLMSEKILIKLSKKYKINYCILRYFNVCGASPSKKIGIFDKNNKSLFKVLANQILKKRPKINIFGDKFKTNDGTCIRDFIHVSDLSEVHFKSLQYINKIKKSLILNCGYGKGYTVLEVVKNFQKFSKNSKKINFKKERKNEIVISYANISKLKKYLKWKPKFNNLSKMIKTSIDWEKKLNN